MNELILFAYVLLLTANNYLCYSLFYNIDEIKRLVQKCI